MPSGSLTRATLLPPILVGRFFQDVATGLPDQIDRGIAVIDIYPERNPLVPGGIQVGGVCNSEAGVAQLDADKLRWSLIRKAVGETTAEDLHIELEQLERRRVEMMGKAELIKTNPSVCPRICNVECTPLNSTHLIASVPASWRCRPDRGFAVHEVSNSETSCNGNA